MHLRIGFLWLVGYNFYLAMKLIGLNCWGGHEFEPLMDFISEHKDTTDFFCFQEVISTSSDKTRHISKNNDGRVNLLQEFANLLGEEFGHFFVPMMNGAFYEDEYVDFHIDHGIAIFYRKNLGIKKTFEKTLIEFEIRVGENEKNNLAIKLQFVEFLVGDKKLTVVNTHGTPYPGNKLDTDERLKQSLEIVDVLKDLEGEIVLTGDFNLLPETKSVRLIEGKLRNLISEFGITQTRSILTGYRGRPDEQFFADYTFVSEGVDVKSFEVPDINISDHLPMILEFKA